MNTTTQFACISHSAAKRAEKRLKKENKLWKKRMKRIRKMLKVSNDKA